MIPDPSLSLAEGALVVNGWQSAKDTSSYSRCILDALADSYGFDINTPYE